MAFLLHPSSLYPLGLPVDVVVDSPEEDEAEEEGEGYYCHSDRLAELRGGADAVLDVYGLGVVLCHVGLLEGDDWATLGVEIRLVCRHCLRVDREWSVYLDVTDISRRVLIVLTLLPREESH